jgi:four helix bundle protein
MPELIVAKAFVTHGGAEYLKRADSLLDHLHEFLHRLKMDKEGSQIRRSGKSIRSNIVEGYGRRRYKMDYIRFLFWY